MFSVYLFVCFFVCVFIILYLLFNFFLPCHLSEMVLLTRDRISLGGFLCMPGLFYQQPVMYPTTFSAGTTASTYDSDDASFLFYFIFFHFISFFFICWFFLKGGFRPTKATKLTPPLPTPPTALPPRNQHIFLSPIPLIHLESQVWIFSKFKRFNFLLTF